jgi:hypothetical protein
MEPDMDDRSHVRRRAQTPVTGTPDARRRALPPAPERLVHLVLELPRLEAALTHIRGRSATPSAALAAVDLEPDEDRLRLFERLHRAREE